MSSKERQRRRFVRLFSRSSGLRRASTRVVLEQRMMFDGAAAATMGDVVVENPVPETAPVLPPSPEREDTSNTQPADSAAPLPESAAASDQPETTGPVDSDQPLPEDAPEVDTSAGVELPPPPFAEPENPADLVDQPVDDIFNDPLDVPVIAVLPEPVPEITSVVFVDGGVADVENLVDQVSSELATGNSSNTGPSVDNPSVPVVEDVRILDNGHRLSGTTLIVTLDTETNGVDQITSVLEEFQELDAIHIVSHGQDAAVKLGDVWLTADSLDDHSSAISAWSGALSADADILFYGCDLANTEDGQNFVERVGELTGADVAASVDETGSQDLGGNWVLEFARGNVSGYALTGLDAQFGWSGLLDPFTVTNTNSSGGGSLAEAISDANGLGGRDEIRFNISASDSRHFYYADDGIADQVSLANITVTDEANDSALTGLIDPDFIRSWYSIDGSSGLPTITDEVVIDGSTQPGWIDTPIIEINGDGTSSGTSGLIFSSSSDSSEVRNLVVNNWGEDAIEIHGDSIIVANNYIGTDVSGTIAQGSMNGVGIFGQATEVGTLAGGNGNLISGNLEHGIEVHVDNDNIRIVDNYIGVDVTGETGLGNGRSGIQLHNDEFTIIARNVVSGNGDYGIEMEGTHNVTIVQNFIGTDKDGEAPIGNTDDGIYGISVNGGVIGGAGQANVISGNGQDGIYLSGQNMEIYSNMIGVNSSGDAAIGNTGAGISLSGDYNTIGGSTGSLYNVVSGNGNDGIKIGFADSSNIDNDVIGNLIGTNLSGTAIISNTGIGLLITDTTSSEIVGNTVSGNTLNGIQVYDSDQTLVSGNNVGTSSSSTIDLGNGSYGVVVISSSNQDINNNLISGNRASGMYISDTTTITVSSNLIGTDGAGTSRLANDDYGIHVINSSGVTIGGALNSDRNVISGNGFDGIYVDSNDVIIRHNYVGLAADGNSDLGNGHDGIDVQNVNNTQILNNIVSWNNYHGISTNGGDNLTIYGNIIGLNATATSAAGNGSTGVIINDTTDARIGGSASSNERNIISANGSDGISISTTGTVIENNSIGTDVNGTAAFGNSGNGMTIATSTDIDILLNVVSANGVNGINLFNGDDVRVYSNIIGLGGDGAAVDDGTDTFGNVDSGINVNGTTNAVIGGPSPADSNIISNNQKDGISANSVGILISNNFVGTDITGQLDRGNGTLGVNLHSSSSGGIISDNLISGNEQSGIGLFGATDIRITGNMIGLNLNGTAAIGNTLQGIQIGSGTTLVTVGGDTAAERNVISGNGFSGVYIQGDNNSIQGNYIGTSADGLTAFGNGTQGIYIEGGNDNLIGGSRSAGEGNLISGNGLAGISIHSGDRNIITANDIGVGSDGVTALGNGALGAAAGVMIIPTGADLAVGNQIGGDNAAEDGNVIKNTTGHGVYLNGENADENSILGNVIYNNSGAGIELSATSGDDTDDADTGPNEGQNFPRLLSVESDGAGFAEIFGTLTTEPDTDYRIEFFSTDVDEGTGEGQVYLGYVDVTTNATGHAIFTTTVTTPVAVSAFVTSTATVRHAAGSYGNSSEFSRNALVENFPTNNDDPVIDNDDGANESRFTVAENVVTVATMTVTDPDAGATHTWSIDNVGDDVHFAIDPVSGELTFDPDPANFEAPLDADTDNEYVIIVRVEDDTGRFDTHTVYVTVTDVNEAPEITSDSAPSDANIDVVEGNTAITTATAFDPDLGDNITWSISGGDDAGVISISPTGAVTFDSAPNFSAPADVGGDNVYEITIRATDDDGLFSEQNIFVTVLDSNVAPVITSDGAADFVEDTALSTPAITVEATDANATDTVTYDITGGADELLFTIDTATGAVTFDAQPNFEIPGDANGDNVYEIEVTASDGALVDVQNILITVTNANESPDITSGSGATHSVTAPENILPTTPFTTVTATDPDFGDVISYDIVGGPDELLFTIDGNGGAITFNNPPDFEIPGDANEDNIYEIVVEASDGTLTDTQTIFVTVTPENEAPEITSDSTADFVENTAVTTPVITVEATDYDVGDSVTFDIVGGADELLFTIDGATGDVTFNASPNAEAPADANGDNVYEITVEASDGTLVDSQNLFFTVTDANEGPEITNFGGAPFGTIEIDENTTTVGTVTASDPDQPADTITYSLVGSQADSGLFSIDETTGEVTLKDPKNFESPVSDDGDNDYWIIVRATDEHGLSSEQGWKIEIADVQEAPVITSDGGEATATVDVVEGNTAVTTVTAVDEDLPADTLNYDITGGADAARFQIDGATGVLTFLTAPDFEDPTDAGPDNVYVVEVTVDDGNNNIDVQTLSISVLPTNEAPDITSDGGNATATITVDEHSTGPVTTVISSDPDAGDSVSFDIVGGADAGAFTIDPDTGELSFTIDTDFEDPVDTGTNNSYEVVVEARDSGNLIDTQTITVLIDDINDAPDITSDGGGANAAVDVAEGTTAVTTVTATDVDLPADTLTYDIIGGVDQGLFDIDSSTGEITFQSAPDFDAPLDQDGDNQYDIEVEVDDGNGGVTTQTIAITVTQVQEAPDITSDGGGATTAVAINENNTAVTTVTAIDGNASDTLTYSIVGGSDAGLFEIDETTGQLSLRDPADFENPADSDEDNNYVVSVQVKDQSGLVDQQLITVTIGDANEPPVIVSHEGLPSVVLLVDENVSVATTIEATSDIGDPVSYQVTTDYEDGGLFSIDSVTGVLSFNAPPDYEAPIDGGTDNIYYVNVRAFDASGQSASQTLSIYIQDVDEGTVTTPETPEEPTTPTTPVDPDPGDPPPVPPVVTTGTGTVVERESGPRTDSSDPQPEREPEIKLDDLSVSIPEEEGELSTLLPSNPSYELPSLESIRRDVDNVFYRLVDSLEQQAELARIGGEVIEPSLHSFLEELRSYNFDFNYTVDLLTLDARVVDISDDLLQVLDEISSKLADAESSQVLNDSSLKITALGLSMTLSAGYLGWLLRFGYLLAGFLSFGSSLRTFDPLPVLTSNKRAREDEEEDDDENEDDEQARKVEELFSN